MVEETRTIRRLLPMNYLSVFDHFLGLALTGLTPFKAISLRKILIKIYKFSNDGGHGVNRYFI